MSLNKLVAADCGGNNSLVQLSNIVGRDSALAQSRTLAQQYVGEFMEQNNTQIPQTFNMNSLLSSMPESEAHKNTQITARPNPSTSQIQWMPGPSSPFFPQQPIMRNVRPSQQLAVILHPQHVSPGQILYESQTRPVLRHVGYLLPVQASQNQGLLPHYQASEKGLIPHNQANDYAHGNTSVQAKAQEFVDKTKDDNNLEYNQFMSFMKKVSAGEMNFEPAQPLETEKSKEKLLNEISEKYKEEWQKLSNVTDVWEDNGIPKEYIFSEGNLMLENMSALELGKEKLKMGDVPGAVICFEAAAQQQPDSATVWFFLGSTQAENEQDPLAITALRKCVGLDPSILEAHMILAAAYANENMPKHAYHSLLDWLKNSPKYNNFPSLDKGLEGLTMATIQEHVRDLYLDAARRAPENVDPDVQNALGVLFNISQEYDKAVDCFKAALMVQNDNPQLWNRLGATLANSNRSEEAVDAYHEALNLEPGFVRARYNVGITCMNLGAHKQAAEHFLVALNQQHKAESIGPRLSSSTSPAIWMTLRMVCSYMGEHKIAKLVDEKNLTELNKFFEIDA